MRTPEQKQADEELTAAIEKVMAAYEMPLEGVLSGYVVFTAHQGFEDDGYGNTRIQWLCKDDEMPWHHIYGLIDMGRFVIDEQRRRAFREDEE